MNCSSYLDTVAVQLVNELKPILDIKGVTANTDLLGKYTEAAVRSLVDRIVNPMRLSTGAVLDHPMPIPLRQIDLIVWAPFPAPALFDIEGFGLVPKSSAFGVIEVKRSNYSGVEAQIESFLADVDAKRIVSDPAGPTADYQRSPGLGVVCVLESTPSSKLQALIDAGRVVAVFERSGEQTNVRSKDVVGAQQQDFGMSYESRTGAVLFAKNLDRVATFYSARLVSPKRVATMITSRLRHRSRPLLADERCGPS